jgi:outer membrane protein assembly factor BamB
MRIRIDLEGACSLLGIAPGDTEADIREKRDRLLERYNPKNIVDRQIPGRVKRIGRYQFARIKLAYILISKFDIAQVLERAAVCVTDHREEVVIYGCEPSNEGVLKWSVELDAPVVLPPAVADGLLFVPCTDNHLYALDVSKGTIKWRFHAGREAPSSPCVAGREVYFSAKGEYVFALDFSIPREKWRQEGIRPTGETPVIYDGRLYVGTIDHSVVALDLGTGAIVSEWQSNARIIGAPRIIDGVLYFSTFPTKESLERVYLETGLREPLEINGPVCSSPIGEGSIVCYATIHRQLHAVDVSNNREIWTLPTSESFSVNPIVEKGTLISAMRHTDLYGVDLRTGAVAWRFKVGDLRSHSPLSSEGMVFIGSTDGYVIGAEAITGEEIMWFRTYSSVTSPAICEDTVFFGSEDNHVYAVTIGAETEDNTAMEPCYSCQTVQI